MRCNNALHALLRASSGITLLLTILDTMEAAVSCNTSQTYEDLFFAGSECFEGFYTNTFTKGRCLVNRVPGWKKICVCNTRSKDPPNTLSLGNCHDPDPGLEYMEIRLARQNWESAFFIAWYVQEIVSVNLSDCNSDIVLMFFPETGFNKLFFWNYLMYPQVSNPVKQTRRLFFTMRAIHLAMVWHILGMHLKQQCKSVTKLTTMMEATTCHAAI